MHKKILEIWYNKGVQPKNHKTRIYMNHYTCPLCQKQFSSRYKNRIYCSWDCSHKSHITRTIYTFNCLTCKKQFEEKRANAKYCSYKCSEQRERNKDHKLKGPCRWCQKMFYSTGNKYFCNQECYKSLTQSRDYIIDTAKKHYEKHVIRNEEGCWGWTGYKNSKGYGQVIWSRKQITTARFSWILHNGDIPEGLLACHHCDNPSCSRIDHIFLGSIKDNAQDKVKKGRCNLPKGEKHHASILTDDEVREIKKLLEQGESNKNLSRMFYVPIGIINCIRIGKTYKHILIKN